MLKKVTTVSSTLVYIVFTLVSTVFTVIAIRIP